MSLSSEQLVYADKLFQLRILRADGQAYENLFVEVMSLRHTDFRAVKPQGPVGDRKNDGYSSRRGVYHQVYAPESAEDNVTKAVAKLEADFAGLLSFWNELCQVHEFYFVLNDKFKGTYPTVEKALLKIKSAHALRECRPFLNADLMRVFSELEERHVMGLVGHLPCPEAIPDLDYSVFTQVLGYVVQNPALLTPAALLTVPDFHEKIVVNRISPQVASLLTTGNLQSGAVERFFSSHSAFSKRAIRDKLAAIYESLKNGVNDVAPSDSHPGDVLFFGLLEAVTPQPAKAHWQAAAIVLLGYFFESCDIYEDPKLLV